MKFYFIAYRLHFSRELAVATPDGWTMEDVVDRIERGEVPVELDPGLLRMRHHRLHNADPGESGEFFIMEGEVKD